MAVFGVAAVVALAAGACGDDEDDSSPAATEAADDTEAPDDTTVPSGDDAETCAMAESMAGEEFPTAEQLAAYEAVAPDEIKDQVSVVVDAMTPAAGDMVATFVAVADDEVTEGILAINAWESEHCGIEHGDELEVRGFGATGEVEDGANVVAVKATDYVFSIDGDTLPAGRTSFVLVNDGQEAHFLFVGILAEGMTIDDAMENEEAFDGMWSTGLAAPGGDDEEVLTFDLVPGDYVMMCFLPAADGTPHAAMGMMVPFSVS